MDSPGVPFPCVLTLASKACGCQYPAQSPSEKSGDTQADDLATLSAKAGSARWDLDFDACQSQGPGESSYMAIMSSRNDSVSSSVVVLSR
jgi:hypothetical protein